MINIGQDDANYSALAYGIWTSTKMTSFMPKFKLNLSSNDVANFWLNQILFYQKKKEICKLIPTCMSYFHIKCKSKIYLTIKLSVIGLSGAPADLHLMASPYHKLMW